MKRTSLLLVSLLLAFSGYAQRYNTAVGARLDRGLLGITVKQRIFKTVMGEAIIVGNQDRVIGSLLAEKHYPIIGRGLSAYMGIGGHLGSSAEVGTLAGPDILVGVDFKAPFMPLNISADIKPGYNIGQEGNDQLAFSTAISVRYVIGKETSKDRKRFRTRNRAQRAKQKEKNKKIKAKEKEKRNKIKDKAKSKRAKEKEKTQKQREKSGIRSFKDWKIFDVFKKDN